MFLLLIFHMIPVIPLKNSLLNSKSILVSRLTRGTRSKLIFRLNINNKDKVSLINNVQVIWVLYRGHTNHYLHQCQSPVPPNNEDGVDHYMSSGFFGSYVDIEGVYRTEFDFIKRYREMALHPEVIVPLKIL